MDATQIILIVFIVALIIIYPIMIVSKNKKENQRMQEQTNSLKRGDKVITTSGVYGTIIDLHLEGNKTIVTIETGTDKNKGYISVDAYAIYSIIKDEEPIEEIPEQEAKSEEVKEEPKAEEVKTEVAEKPEENQEQPKKKEKKK